MENDKKVAEVLQREFLGIRARLIDIASTLDRIDRAHSEQIQDLRLEKIRQAIGVLSTGAANRVEQIQLIFSLENDK